ncbi:hypothetical protein MesoLjLc_66170 [Mesorhizobium sp. L-8-10]|nr:hypothetical protein MesoLjLc_66170 [Mesorhizobium sp. L-8-10]
MISKHLGKKIAALTNSQLLDGTWYKFPAIATETRLPSFFLAWRGARKSWAQHGLGGVDAIGMGYGYD